MRILFLACLRANTGNSTTALRIKSHLEAAGHECELRDAASLEGPLEVAKLLSQKKFDAGLVIHLYKAGRFLLGNSIPFGAVFGGTDINEDVKNEEKFRVMEIVLENARFVVAFTNKIREAAAKHWPKAVYKIHIQPQGVFSVRPTRGVLTWTPSASFWAKGFPHERESSHTTIIKEPRRTTTSNFHGSCCYVNKVSQVPRIKFPGRESHLRAFFHAFLSSIPISQGPRYYCCTSHGPSSFPAVAASLEQS